jgi:hypothetical protein
MHAGVSVVLFLGCERDDKAKKGEKLMNSDAGFRTLIALKILVSVTCTNRNSSTCE